MNYLRLGSMDTVSNHGVYVQPERPLAWRIADYEAQVFVDHSGRRARAVRILGAAMAGMCALWLAGLVIGMAGFSGFPSVPSPVRLLPALARVGTVPGATRRVQARELASDHGAERARET
jgi:hypothetical protein